MNSTEHAAALQAEISLLAKQLDDSIRKLDQLLQSLATVPDNDFHRERAAEWDSMQHNQTDR